MRTPTEPDRASCPSGADLERFALGAPCPDAETLERHLLACPRCLEVAQSVSEDPLVEAVRRSTLVQREGTIDTLVGELVNRLTKLVGPSLPDPFGDLETTDLRGGRPSEPPTYPFLAPPQAPDEIGRLGVYRVLEVLGHGGMGIVFRAEDPGLKREVALKVIKAKLAGDPGIRQRFLREAQAAAAIEHEHVATIYQVSEDGGVPFIAMPLLRGESLQARFDREGRLPLAEVLRIGREIAEALEAAHERGLIHRDIKPANVWLEGEHGKVKVLDFGLARPERDTAGMTQSGMVLGTPEFMAPEQATGEAAKIDKRADLFSLGVVLYALSTGELPFRGPHVMAVLQALAVCQPPPPRERNPEVPEALSRLVMRLLAKRREDRPASAREVAETLAALKPQTTAPRAGPQWGRWLTAAAALLSAGVLAVLLIIQVPGSKSVVVVKTNDPNIDLEVKDGGAIVRIIDKTSDQKWDLDTKRYTLSMANQPDGLTISLPDGKKFILKRKGKEAVTIERPPEQPPLPPPPPIDLLAEKIRVAVLGDGPRHDARAYAVAISPDSKWIASGSDAGDVRLWEAQTLRLRATLKGANGNVRVVAFTPDGKTLIAGASAAGTNQLLVWDLSETKLEDPKAELPDPTVQSVGSAREDAVTAIAFSRDPKRFATVHHDQANIARGGAVRLWEINEGLLIQRHRLSEHKDKPICVALSPEGDLLASGGREGDVRLYRLTKGKPTFLHSLDQQHEGGATAVAFNPKGETFATATGDGTLRLWQVGDKPTMVFAMRVPGMAGLVGTPGQENCGPLLAFAPDGKSLAYGGAGTTGAPLALGLLDLADPERPVVMPVKGYHALPLKSLAFAADGNTVVTAHEEGSLFLVWDVTVKGLRARRPPHGSLARMRQVAFSPDGKTLAASGLDAEKGLSVFLWDWQRDKEGKSVVHSNIHGGDVPVKKLIGEFSDIGGVRFPWMAFLPEGRALATVSSHDGKLRVWAQEKGRPREQYVGQSGLCKKVAASPDGRWLASGDHVCVQLWAVGEGGKPRLKARLATPVLAEPAFSRDSKRMATGDVDGIVKLWDLTEEEPRIVESFVSRPPQGGHVRNHIYSLAWSPDRKFLVTGDVNAMVRLWDMSGTKARELGVVRGREAGWVWSLAFSPDSKLLAAGGEGNDLPVWDVASRTLRYRIKVPAVPFGVAFAPDGKHLATANMNGTVHVLRLPGQ